MDNKKKISLEEQQDILIQLYNIEKLEVVEIVAFNTHLSYDMVGFLYNTDDPNEAPIMVDTVTGASFYQTSADAIMDNAKQLYGILAENDFYGDNKNEKGDNI